MRRFNSKKGYTLTEVVIVMLVVAVVVSVSIKITKAKLDNIVSYTYYSGYSTLKGVTSQMVKDFKASDQQYMAVPDLSAYNRIFMFRNALFPVMNIGKYIGEDAMALGNGTLSNGNGALGNEVLGNGNSIGTPSTHPECNYYYGRRPTCPDGQTWMDYPICACRGVIKPDEGSPKVDFKPGDGTPGTVKPGGGSLFNCDKQPTEAEKQERCSRGQVFSQLICDWVTKVCTNGQTWSTEECACVSNSSSGSGGSGGCHNAPTSEQKDARYCSTGQRFNDTICDWENISPWPPCVGDEYRWDVTQCKCVPEPITIPRSGQNFCEKFVSYSNTKSGSAECTGSKIDATLTDFSEQTPDITLRNGMRIYNIRQNPGEIADLVNNTQGAAYDGVPNVNTYGYTVYIDIDGEKGPSTLWQDVYRFYITMAGKVIPAYDMASNADEVGGNSRQHLMTSIEKEGIDATGHRKLYWVSKSVSFKEGACASGYFGAQTNYCNGVALKDACSGASSSCVLKFVSPIKFFK